MKPSIRRYITTFLLTGIPYGGIMIGIDLLRGQPFVLWKFLFLTVFFGLFVSIMLNTWRSYLLKKKNKSKES